MCIHGPQTFACNRERINSTFAGRFWQNDATEAVHPSDGLGPNGVLDMSTESEGPTLEGFPSHCPVSCSGYLSHPA